MLAALERNPLFISAALPNHVYPPLFNRYAEGMDFGNHVDGSIRMLPGSDAKLRTDLSATLFLSSPEDYAGGELCIAEGAETRTLKLPAGDLILYPATRVHRVNPVTRGERLASFFWVQSLVGDGAARELLFSLDRAIQRLNAGSADPVAHRPDWCLPQLVTPVVWHLNDDLRSSRCAVLGLFSKAAVRGIGVNGSAEG